MCTCWFGKQWGSAADIITSVISSLGSTGVFVGFGIGILYVYLAGVLPYGVEPGLCRGEVVGGSSDCLAVLTFGNMVICFLIMG